MDRVGGGGAPGENVADRRVGLRVDVEVVGEVALRVEVDREHAQPGVSERLRQVAYGVVLPVPPFWESTAIVSAMCGESRRAANRAGRRPRLRPSS